MHDGETEAEATVVLADRIVELMEFLEYRAKLLSGDAGAGVPNLDAQLVAAPPAAEQDLAALGVFHCVREQIADHLLEQARVAPNAQPAGNHVPDETMRLSMIGKFDPQPLEQVVDREIDLFRVDAPGLELIDVEERVQHAQQSVRRLVEPGDQHQGLFVLFVLDLLRQDSAHQAESLQRLPQVMASGGKEA